MTMSRKDNNKRRFFSKMNVVVLGLILSLSANAQTVNPTLLQKQWKASWIKVPDASDNGYGVYIFRKTLELAAKPASFVIHVSADNHYKLFVNEKIVSIGPARSDLANWRFETVDIAPYLKAGKNIVAAIVWNEADKRPASQISLRTGFILQGNSENEQVLNTNKEWKCIQDKSYAPLRVNAGGYYIAGPGELVDMKMHLRGWEQENYDDSAWGTPKRIGMGGTPKNVLGNAGMDDWLLVPSIIPQMELTEQRINKVRKTVGLSVPSSFPASKVSITVPANTTATLLLDQTYLTNAYPTLEFSGGINGSISLTYAEALFLPSKAKENRNEIEGKTMIGRKDSILSDGSKNQLFTPLTWRTYRYIQVRVITKNDPLVIDDIYGTFTAYPFKLNAKLESDNQAMSKILEVGWRTARLCAMETYMDTPYYEQLQYIGDTRIQALVSLFNSGDDRLVRNALTLIDNSRRPDGLTPSRPPAYQTQFITPFSLWYIGMLHDYMLYGNDLGFIKKKLVGARQVLNYFQQLQIADGSLKDVPYWLFTDWAKGKDWDFGVAPIGKDGCSAVLDLQLLLAYETAADLENKVGMKEYAALYQQYADQLKATLRNKYWDADKKLLADRAEKDVFSQHANALAILTDVVSGDESLAIAKQLVSDNTLVAASVYFKYYVNQALVKAGLGNDYMSWLGKWHENLNMGLTTWAEESEVETSRSDCHAWGASPNIEFFRTILGIDSDAPGFSKVKIEPHLGTIKTIAGEMPHPNGKISVSYKVSNEHISAKINLPLKITGQFIWKGKTYPLNEGENIIKI
jgi:alpha-L-rhamnosidase